MMNKTSKKAIIIEGNREYMSGPGKELMDPFYNEIHSYLESKGFEVERDPGLPFTSPPKADLWLGHSRGVDRLKFASPGIKLIAFGTKPEKWMEEKGVVIANHPLEPLSDKPASQFTRSEREAHIKNPNQKYHFVFTDEMKRTIDLMTEQKNNKKFSDSIFYHTKEGQDFIRGVKEASIAKSALPLIDDAIMIAGSIKNKKDKKKEEEAKETKEASQKKYKPESVILVAEKNGKVLATSRKYDHNDFGLVGGKIERGEDHFDALKREVKEETGLNASNLKHIMTADNQGYTVHIYRGDVSGKIGTEENLKVKWVPWETVLQGSFGDFNKKLHRFIKAASSIDNKDSSEISLLNTLKKNFDKKGLEYFVVVGNPQTGGGASIYNGRGVYGAAHNARQAHIEWEKTKGIDPEHDWGNKLERLAARRHGLPEPELLSKESSNRLSKMFIHDRAPGLTLSEVGELGYYQIFHPKQRDYIRSIDQSESFFKEGVNLNGFGLGRKAYGNVARKSWEDGIKTLTSDSHGQTSPEATRVWQSLAKRGWPVTEHNIPGKARFSIDLEKKFGPIKEASFEKPLKWLVGELFDAAPKGKLKIGDSVVKAFEDIKPEVDRVMKESKYLNEEIFRPSQRFSRDQIDFLIKAKIPRNLWHKYSFADTWQRVEKDASDFSLLKEASEKNKDIELWNAWKKDPGPHTLSPLMKQINPIIRYETAKWKPSLVNQDIVELEAKNLAFKALHSYNPDKSQLNTHITNNLKHLSRFVMNRQNAVREAEEKTYNYRKFLSTKDELEMELGREPTHEEIESRMGHRGKLGDYTPIIENHYSMAAESGNTPMQDSLSGDQIGMDLLYNNLNDKHKYIFKNTYGYQGVKPKSNKEIAAALGTSEANISQHKRKIEEKARLYISAVNSVTGY